ncbi:signal transduction histidine kinase [Actinocorallia herbida]|uniref:histidine kinase n=1 Tax=Actinocorallia herbida TaxID=58109 RepID=A0A3N1DB88_9ACTN|nr:ATP-binding protein [Actinocorallia herbida]ROO90780.1 signal transduction histidine kinase [Actinocorallia herbida]
MSGPTRARMTIRVRLTAMFGGLFLLAGIVLLGVTYFLVSTNLPEERQVITKSGFLPDGAGGVMPTLGEMTQVREVQQGVLGAVLTQGALALVVVGAAAIAFGWLLAGRLLQPLQRVTETARRIAHAPAADRGLHERIGLTGPRDEVAELADTFDLMLERLDASFDGQRRFIADASHELRTPLTLNRALLEVAVHRRNASAEVRQLGETLLEVNARHERLIEGLLMLARSDAEIADRAYLDVADIAEHVAVAVPREGVGLTVRLDEAPAIGDTVLLERLVQNLVENAVRHNLPEGGRVEVVAGTSAQGSAFLTVANTGPVVPAYEIPSLFTPFHRRNKSRLHAPGAGLGLSIVRSIVQAHGARLRTVPGEAGGLVHIVEFPPVPDALRGLGAEGGVVVDSGAPAREERPVVAHGEERGA